MIPTTGNRGSEAARSSGEPFPAGIRERKLSTDRRPMGKEQGRRVNQTTAPGTQKLCFEFRKDL
jgi:hypothetical protein